MKPERASRWPHYWAIGLCLLTFPLLWMGGLVTSTDAGMAVPDWPSTYGYNMFAYPWQTWLFGPWDLFIEHGHRLMGSLVGMVTIGLVVSASRAEPRRWVRRLSIAALLLVCLQGGLGGARVTENERVIAMIHGCTGPLFFMLAAILVVVTSSAWRETGAANRRNTVPRSLAGWLLGATVLAYVQLTLGAQLRHAPASASTWAFAAIVKLHLLFAGLVTLHVLWSVGKVFSSRPAPGPFVRISLALVAVLAIQLGLGGCTWLLKYGAPDWAPGWLPATIGANVADGWTQTNVVTAHQACGSLLLGLLAAATAIAWRHAAPGALTTTPSTLTEGQPA